MTRGIRFASRFRPNTSYVCLCQSRLSSPASQLRPVQQKRWITRKHVAKIKQAMEDWEERADAIRQGQKQSMLSLLEERGFVNQIVGARKDLDNLLTERRVSAYVGVDPTAQSLHVGHLVPFMALGWLFIHGYGATFLLGGTTARIGDPTDRLTAREAEATSTRKANMVNMHMQLKRLGVHMETMAAKKGYMREWAWRREVVNNSVWYGKVNLTEFMRVLGSGIRMGPLLGRDTVKNRLEKGDGMSFAEFSYPLLQAWDWWELFKRGVQVQVGGADQFGNILAGAEAVKIAKKVDQVHFENDGTFQGHVGSSLTPVPKQSPNYGPNINEPMGFTVPLLTTSAGEKFGKSAGNAIWLDKSLTSATELYQFFIRTADADVERYLKLFTFLSIPEIRGIMEDHRLDESKGLAQKKLASEFVELIHGESAAQEAETQHMKLFGPNVSIDDLREESSSSAARSRVPGDWNSSLNPYAKATSSENAPSIRMKLPRSLVVGRPFTGVLWSAGLVSSKGEAQRLISSKGCHIGARIGRDKDPTEMGDSLAFLPITSTHPDDTEQFLIDGHLLVIRIGKWKMKIINVVSDEEYDASGLTCPGWKEPADSGKEDYKKRQQEISAFIASKRQKQAQIQKMPKAERQTRDYQMDEEE